ncbi:protein kinase domain-containing protein [Solidesulfovibrio sp. C21]|uniref:protein kinase domain-containing protein n=1 Tax=Solidesulfovibrio sp. C21 TaxID=3398613 RepID=UPI0039FDA85A
MDNIRAKRISSELLGKNIDGWELERYINCGKSALVFQAKKDDTTSALKIFDPELVEKYGKETQISRIEREKELIENGHQNIVKIFGGGECKDTNYLYVAMEFLPYNNLHQQIAYISNDKIKGIITQLANAAKHLEDLGLAHRDIKPENICITDDFNEIKLLDLGVLKPISDSDMTDDGGHKFFIGTLRYSPKEYLYRVESDDIEGWRAITFYQIGAVLHDLIMKKQLFSEYEEPFALLVDAVKEVTPKIDSITAVPELSTICRRCLVKDPTVRLSLVKWEDFEFKEEDNSIDLIKAQILKNRLLVQSQSKPKRTSEQENFKREIFLKEISELIKADIIETCCTPMDIFPRRTIVTRFNSSKTILTIKLSFEKSLKNGLFFNPSILFTIEAIDVVDKIFKIQYAAIGTKDAPKIELFDSCPPQTLYTGHRDDSDFKQTIMLLLYNLIKIAQETELGNEASTAIKL